MTKRATIQASEQERRRVDRAEGIKAKGTSKYARKHARQVKGTYKPPQVQHRPSWFSRLGWEQAANHNVKAAPHEMDPPWMRRQRGAA